MAERIASNCSGMDYGRILRNDMDRPTRSSLWKTLDAFNDTPGCLDVFTFNSHTIDDVLAEAEIGGYDAVVIDYFGLLKLHNTGVRNAQQWEVYSDMSRRCKNYSIKTGALTIGLVQLTKEGDIARSKDMASHADYVWKWECKEEDRERGYVECDQFKARKGALYPLLFTIEFAQMRMQNIESPLDMEMKSPSKSGGEAKTGGKLDLWGKK